MFSVPVSVRSIVSVAYAIVSVVVSKSSVVKSADVTFPSLFPRVVVNEVVEVWVFIVDVIDRVPLYFALSMRQLVKVIKYESEVVPADIVIVLAVPVVAVV